MRHWHGGWTAGEWMLMGFGMLLFWGLVVAGIVLLLRYVGTERRTGGAVGVGLDKTAGPARPTAREILDERYARGEIGDEEYRTRRDTLAAR